MLTEVMDRPQAPVEQPVLTPAEKRDARRAAKALKKLQAEDKAAVLAEVVTDVVADLAGLAKLHAELEPGPPAKDVIKPAASAKQLIAFVERVENINEEIAERAGDRKEIFAEAKSAGFDVPTLRKIVALRAMHEDKRLQAEALLSTYMHAVGLAVQTEMTF